MFFFLTFLGTPRVLSFGFMQIPAGDRLYVAIPYPSGTTFNVYASAPPWCSTCPDSWCPTCRHNYRSVPNMSAFLNSFGDTYFFETSTNLLHLRLVSLDPTFSNYPYFGNRNTYINRMSILFLSFFLFLEF